MSLFFYMRVAGKKNAIRQKKNAMVQMKEYDESSERI